MAKVSLRAYNREIEAMIDRSHLEEAVAHCQHILKTFPKHLETYRLLGKAYLEAKRHDEAVDIFSRVLAAEPNDFVAHVGMSIIRDEQDKLDDAIWHMERAFEVQSANPAIQAELQRLYGRRDGTQPPRVRMTRGALAHMYMRGELYPQAISETKSVLEDDQERSDMQVLLAKAYFKSGQKNDAADAASAVLKRYPFCLDANLVLAEILGNDRPESAQIYRQRVIELDPYAAQAVDNMFLAGKVSDAAVSIDHLEWNGQPVGMSTDWGSKQAIGLESGIRDEQPDWMKADLSEDASASMPAFASEQEASPGPVGPEDDIPEFLRAAGWGESTGSFDESKSSIFDDEPAPSAEPLAEGDLPEWIKAMAPKEASQPEGGQEEEIPDWINKIGTDELPIPSVGESSEEDLDWMKDLGQDEPPSLEPSAEQADWPQGVGEEETPALQGEEQPDWLKGFGEEDKSTAGLDEEPDWLKNLGQEDEVEPEISEQPASLSTEDQFGLVEEESLLVEEEVISVPEGQPDLLKEVEAILEPGMEEQPLGESAIPANEISETEQLEQPQASVPATDTGGLGISEKEQEDSFAWLENLAAKQGATEGLLTKPEERLEDEPEWIKQAKGLSQPADLTSTEETQQEMPEPPVMPVDPSSLGKTEQERDDSFAWLEALAAKQGATEGLLTKPEERLEQEPDWVKQVKKATGELPSEPEQQIPVEQETAAPEPEAVSPTLSTDEQDYPGTTDAERDDSFAWLENLAAKQGATEGLLTKPEERLEQEPEWVQQSKVAREEKAPEPSMETPVPAETEQEPEAQTASVASADDVSAWLNTLDEEEETPPAADEETATWLKSLDEAEEEPLAFESTTREDLPAWMQDIDSEKASSAESEIPVEEEEVSVEVTASETETESEAIPDWLSSLEEEEKEASKIPAADDLPAWMRDETGELVAEPTKIDPMRSSDWTPMDEMVVESEETSRTAPEPAPEPEPEPPAVSAEAEKPEPKPKKAVSKKKEVKPEGATEPYREPVTIRGTGMLSTPVDPILGSARTELSRSNIPGALDAYGKLIKKGRFLEEVIFDLREALYRYPVEVSIWQALGDAYMRANQLQDALDAYTKAEELLR